MVFAKPDPVILLLSTFHQAFGLFQECVLPGNWVVTEEGLKKIEDVTEKNLVLNKQLTTISKMFG